MEAMNLVLPPQRQSVEVVSAGLVAVSRRASGGELADRGVSKERFEAAAVLEGREVLPG